MTKVNNNLGEQITNLDNPVSGNITPNKLYMRHYDASATHVPSGTHGTLYHMYIDGEPYATQLVVDLNRDIFTRAKNAGVWSAWEGYTKNADLGPQLLQSWTFAELQSNATKSANWNNYQLIICCTGNYDNTRESITVPTSYFANTGTQLRVILKTDASAIEVYKASESSIKILTENLLIEQTLKIYGVLHK